MESLPLGLPRSISGSRFAPLSYSAFYHVILITSLKDPGHGYDVVSASVDTMVFPAQKSPSDGEAIARMLPGVAQLMPRPSTVNHRVALIVYEGSAMSSNGTVLV